jgi:hypothetical protein
MAAALISTVVGVPFAWYLMKKNLWLPMWLGVGFMALGLVVCLFLPETLERSKLLDPAFDSSMDEIDETPDRPNSSHQYPKRKNMSRMFAKMKDSHFIFTSPMLFALSVTFLLQTLSIRVTEFLFQLASERFHWPLGDVGDLSYKIQTMLIIHVLGQLPHSYRLNH